MKMGQLMRGVVVGGLVWMGLAAAAVAAPPVRALATTAMVADLVRQVGGDDVQVETLMGPGVDPHLYKASASDIIKLQRAQAIFYNGLMLEGRMADVLARLARSGRSVHAVAEAVPAERLLEAEDYPGQADPHLWFDVELWALGIERVLAGLRQVDPERAPAYEARAQAARERLAALQAWARAKAAEVPEARRVLVTSHDAYSYFGRAYGFQVVGLQGISTVSEAALADMAKLVDFIRARGVPAIFVESSVSPVTLRRIAEDAGVRIGGELFSDAMGAPGQIERGFDVGTYEGMVKYNLTTIVEALR